MPAGYDVQLALRGGHPRYRQRHCRVDVAGDKIDLIFVDQLASSFDSGRDIVRRISNRELRFTAKNTAGMVDLVDGEPGACDLALGKRRIDPGEGLDHADLYRLFGASANWKRRQNRARGACQPGFENGATASSTCVRRRCLPRFLTQAISSGPAGSKFSGPRLRRQGARRYAPSSPGRGAKSTAGYDDGGAGVWAARPDWRGGPRDGVVAGATLGFVKPRDHKPIRRGLPNLLVLNRIEPQGVWDVCP